jgi:hypothetical protein
LTIDYEKIAEGCLLLEQSKKDTDAYFKHLETSLSKYYSKPPPPRGRWSSLSQWQKDAHERDLRRVEQRREQFTREERVIVQKETESRKAVEDFAVENLPEFKEKFDGVEASVTAHLERRGFADFVTKEQKDGDVSDGKKLVRQEAVDGLERLCKTPTM